MSNKFNAQITSWEVLIRKDGRPQSSLIIERPVDDSGFTTTEETNIRNFFENELSNTLEVSSNLLKSHKMRITLVC